MMPSLRERFFNTIDSIKQIGSPRYAVDSLIEETGDAYKAVIPQWLYKTPFGYPRLINIAYLRRLGKSAYAFMAINTIADEVASVPWEIQPKDKEAFNEAHIREITDFFKTPNKNNEPFDQLLRKAIRDVLEVDTGIWIKIFDNAGRFSQIMAYDGATFTKNPDRHGSFEGREEFVLRGEELEISKNAAYYQYGWHTPANKPIPFGRREVVWFERNPRADQHYGRSPIEVLADVIQALVYGETSYLEHFTNNKIPRGVLSIIGASQDHIDALKMRWQKTLKRTDALGDKRTFFHQLPVINEEVKFTRFQMTPEELALLDTQKWFCKIVWACFGVTPSELGFTESITRATDLSQSRVFKRKAIRPLLELIEYKINMEVIPEFGYEDIKFTFIQKDLEEDMVKAKLYETYLRSNIMTVNEIREEMGKEPVEWGDEKPKAAGGFGGLGTQLMRPPVTEETRFAPKSVSLDIKEEKAATAASPLAPKEREVAKFYNIIKKYYAKKERDILEEIRKIQQTDAMSKIKILGKTVEVKTAFAEFVERLKKQLDAGEIEPQVYEEVKNMFMKGVNAAEVRLDMNFVPNMAAVDFIKTYVFKNIKGLTDELSEKLRKELEMAMMNGEGIPEIKKRVKNVFDITDNRAEMIVRTETTRAFTHGALESYKEAQKRGVDGKKEWLATFDDKTCPICKALHGQQANLDKHFEHKGQKWLGPPSHVNCRCDVLYRT